MDYKKKYEKLVDAVKVLRDNNPSDEGIHNWVNDNVPELKESEDERIKKNCIYFLELQKQHHAATFEIEECIAWLEKQKNFASIGINFKVGDWVVFNNNHESIYQIEKIKNFQYILRHILGGSMPLSFSSENMLRLWTLQDAKDGNVLSFYSEYRGNKMMQVGIVKEYVGKHGGCSNTFSVYVGMNWENNLQIGRYMGCDDIQPATKKQCDLLFTKMKEAGYKWNANKKELIKAE